MNLFDGRGCVVVWVGGCVGMLYPIHKYFLVNRISYRVGETENLFITYLSKEYILIRMVFCSGSHSVCVPVVSVTPQHYCAENNIR